MGPHERRANNGTLPGAIPGIFGEKKEAGDLLVICLEVLPKRNCYRTKNRGRKTCPRQKEFVVADTREFIGEKMKLVECIRRFFTEGATVASSMHPFFGQLSSQEWAVLAYKHLDHHLQQLGA